MTRNMRLPSGWKDVTLGDVIRIIRGVSYKKQQASNEPAVGMISILRATNIDGLLNFKELVYVPEECVSDEQMLRPGDIVIAASSGSRKLVGKAAQLLDDWSGSFGAFCMGLRPNTGIEPKYIGYFLQSDEYRKTVSKLAAGSNINNLKRSHIETLRFPLAPEQDQRQIVAKLDELFSDLDAGVAALKRAQANLKRYRAAVLKAAVEGKLTEQWRAENLPSEPASVLLERILAERRKKWEEEQLKNYGAKGRKPSKNWREKYKEPAEPDLTDVPLPPEGWTVASVDQLTTAVTSGSRDWKNYYDRGSGTFIMAQNVRPYRIDLASRQAVDPPADDPSAIRSQVAVGDLLVTIVGANTGDVCVVDRDLPEHYVCQSVALMRPAVSRMGPYINVYLNSREHGQRQYRRFIYGAGRPHLSFEQLKKTAVMVPPLQEQREIAQLVNEALDGIQSTESLVALLMRRAARLRGGILKRAFEGALVAQDPTDESAGPVIHSGPAPDEPNDRRNHLAEWDAQTQLSFG